MSSAHWATEFVRQISRPRLAGSAALSEVQGRIGKHLEQLGFQVHWQTFRASPQRLIAVSVAGAGFGACAFLLVPMLWVGLAGWPVAFVGLAGFAVIGIVSYGVAQGHLPTSDPRPECRNLIATRGTPKLWLVAHADSKGQGLSLAGRVGALVLGGTGVVLMAGTLAVQVVSPVSWWWVGGVGMLMASGGAAVSRRPLRDDSPGAVDNATGVVAALVAAEAVGERNDVGILVTDAEEFGMEGARAWVAAGPGGGAFINFDSLDNRGPYRVLAHVPTDHRDGSDAVASELVVSLQAAGAEVRRAALPLGIYVDGAVLAGAGMWGVTVSRGTLGTLRRVHTRRDTVDRTDVQGAVTAGLAAAATVGRLLS